ncbi:MAG: hypothetical protein H3C34_01000 [Caldilineaceae bacterium]|nr:hypothetical protein [Caldilineaceae bacterium]
MRAKILSLLVVLLLLLSTFSTAFAQPEPFCGDLDEADCALIQNAEAAMMDLTSYRSLATYNATVAGLPGLPVDEIVVDLEADAVFSLDESALEAMQELAMVESQEDVAMLMEESPEVFVAFYDGVNFDMSLSAMGNAEVVDLLSQQSGLDVPESLSIGLIMVDGVLYADLTELKPLIPELAGVEGWIGIELVKLIAAAVEQGVFAQAAQQMSPEAMTENMEMSGIDPASVGALLGVQAALANPEAFEQFLSIARVDDAEINGEQAAVFVTSFDIAAFISSPEFVDMVKMLAASGALGDDAPTEADIEQGLQMVGLMGPMLFQGLKAQNTLAVGLDSNYVLATGSLFSWDLGSLLQMAAMSGALPADMMPTGAAAIIEFSTEVTNSDFDADLTIEEPAGAQVIPAEIMMSN